MENTTETNVDNGTMLLSGNSTVVDTYMFSMKKNPMLGQFIASIISSTIATVIFHPLDTVRFHQIKNNTNITDAIRTIYRENFRFYRALPIGCFAYAATYGVYFPISEMIKANNIFHISNSLALYASASLPATLCSMTITNPIWTTKSLQISSPKPISILQSITTIYQASGVRGFYKGLLFGYANGMNGVIAFTLYDVFKDISHANTSVDYALCSAASKTAAYCVTFPIFALRVRHQLSQDTIWNVCKQVKSVRGAYRGLSMTLIQMVPRTSVMMVFYEAFKKLFDV